MDKITHTIVVASKNPAKINATLEGMQRMFPEEHFSVLAVSVSSGVADQPMSDEETLEGAMNRVANAQEVHPEADYWVGLEGGVTYLHGELAAFAWIVVKSENQFGKARSGLFFLPQAVTTLVEQGIELGIANDMIFSQINSKQKGGAIGILTNNALNRKELYAQAVVLALLPFKNQQLYTSLSKEAE